MTSSYYPWPDNDDKCIKILQYDGNTPIDTHKHDFIEIVYVARGSCLHNYAGISTTLLPGDVFVVIPHETHSYSINSNTVLYNCIFYPQALGEDWNYMKSINSINNFLCIEPFFRDETTKHMILHLNSVEITQVESLITNILHEQTTKQQDSNLIIKGYFLILLTVLGRAWHKHHASAITCYNSKRELIARALDYIHQNLKDEMKIESLAAQTYLSPHYFRKIFKEVTGLSPIDYINKLRISKAMQLLANENLSFSKIAEIIGINDLSYFSRLFKNTTGMSPSEYRKKTFCANR